MTDNPALDMNRIARWGALVFGVLALLIALIFGVVHANKVIGRYQKEANAKNDAKIARIAAANEQEVNRLRIAAQEQKVQIAKQDAEIEFTKATGLRRAQDEIAKTLTPLYIQHQAIEAYREAARFGNHTVYIPSGESGIPLVKTTP
jgi:Na+-transporting methylmalonyl-CoA/oxaloacetate decarboxylase gamma subunit